MKMLAKSGKRLKQGSVDYVHFRKQKEALAEPETRNFLTFADFFFDGFLKDIMIQSKIRKTQDQIDTAVHRVENMPDCLERGSLK